MPWGRWLRRGPGRSRRPAGRQGRSEEAREHALVLRSSRKPRLREAERDDVEGDHDHPSTAGADGMAGRAGAPVVAAARSGLTRCSSWAARIRSGGPASRLVPAPDRGARFYDGGPTTVMALLLVAATAVAVAVVAVMLHGPAAPVTVQSASSTSDASPAAATESPAVGTPASSSPDTQLRAVASSDSAAVEGLAGSWVPQLSSKRPGLVVDGQTDDAAAILAEHQALRSAHPEPRFIAPSSTTSPVRVTPKSTLTRPAPAPQVRTAPVQPTERPTP